MITACDSPQLDDIFSALAHRKRRGIIESLSYRPATISQLAAEYKLSLPAMHKHLLILERARLIRRKKAGRTNFVALDRQSLRSAQGWLNQYRTDWGNDKESLENYIARFEP